ncbi:MAG: lysophospholipid acyltransferase family protein [Nocardioides sp.]
MSDLTYRAIVLAAKASFRLLGQRIEMTGTQQIPTAGAGLLAFNHVSYVDYLYGGLAAQPSRRLVRVMAKRELFDHRWVGPVMRSVGHLEVDRERGESSLRAAVAALRAGELVGIFPEATISRALVVKELKTGAVRIAARAGVPLIPVALWGTQRILTKDHPRDLTRGRLITVRVGEPLRPSGADPIAETAELRAALSALVAESVAAYPAAEQPPGAWWLPAEYGGSAPTLLQATVLDERERAARRERQRKRR